MDYFDNVDDESLNKYKKILKIKKIINVIQILFLPMD
jgi:hypothetical protein